MPISSHQGMLALPCSSKHVLFTAVFAIAAAVSPMYASSQAVKPEPATDSSAQASPLKPVSRAPADDTSAQASPISPERSGGVYVAPHTSIPVALGEAIDSGKLKQGQNVKARLTAAVPVHGRAPFPAGTPVALTAIESVPAGRIMSQGELSLQVLRIGSLAVYTNTLVFDGKAGHQDLPDSAPALGTDAGLPQGAPLIFRVLPPPVDADQLPPPGSKNGGHSPGSVNGTASGAPPPASSVQNTYGNTAGAGSGKTPAQQQKPVSPGDTTTNQQTQQSGQTSVAPNQPQSPGQTSPNPSQPR